MTKSLRIVAMIGAALLLVGCPHGKPKPPEDPRHCAALSQADCMHDATCEVAPGCCGAASTCVAAGTQLGACPQFCSCDNLDDTDCAAANATLGCGVQTCTDCALNVTNRCAAPGQPEPPECTFANCPRGDGSACDSHHECPGPYQCQPTEYPSPPTCTKTAECGTGATCTNGQCVQLSCITAKDCPAQFDCSASQCQRLGCGQEEDCDTGGHCVGGLCYDKAGICETG